MLALKLRLKTADLQKFFDSSNTTKRVYKAGAVWVMVISNGRQYSRFGIVFSKKMFNGSVERNRCKRRLRAIIYKHLSRIQNGLDVVFMIQRVATNYSFVQLESSIINSIKKSQIII